MLISLDINDILATNIGTFLVVAWYTREEGGQHFAPAQYNGPYKDKIKVAIRPHGEGLKNLILAEYNDHFIGRGHQEYILKLPTAKELSFCQKSFGENGDQEELFVPVPMSAKEIAIALMGVITVKPMGSKKLCTLAGVEYGEMVPLVLQKLASLGKLASVRVRNAQGKVVRRYNLPGPS